MLKLADTDFEGLSAPVDSEHRAEWVEQRRALEAAMVQPGLLNGARVLRKRIFKAGLRTLAFGLQRAGLYERGLGNAATLQRTEIEMSLDALPREFDGYRIAHISDCHFDADPATLDRLKVALAGETVDLCVLTGDYQDDRRSAEACRSAASAVGDMIAGFGQQHGVLAVLGNHDCIDIVEPLEAHGVRVLGNESVSVVSGRERVIVTGLDDVHYFESPLAHRAVAEAPEGFRIVLVHSPEMAEAASLHGHDLYLCGHTHGGQISLPGGRAVFTGHRGERRFSDGR